MQAACVMLCFTAPHAFSIYIQLNFRYQIFFHSPNDDCTCAAHNNAKHHETVSRYLAKTFFSFSIFNNLTGIGRHHVEATFSTSCSPSSLSRHRHSTAEMRFIIKEHQRAKKTFTNDSKVFLHFSNLKTLLAGLVLSIGRI